MKDVPAPKLLRGLYVSDENLPDLPQSCALQQPLIFLGLTTSKLCNYHCRYCAQDAGKAESHELDAETLCNLVRQGKELGAHSIILAGAGEPLLDPALSKLVDTAANNRMTTVLYTNGSMLTPEIATFLYERDVSVCLKLDTYDPVSFNWLTGNSHAYQLTMQGLEHLLAVGYLNKTNNNLETRLAINAVVTKANLPDLITLAVFCAERGIKLFLDNISLAGRALTNWQELITKPEEYVEICAKINQTLGYEAVGHSLDRSESCILWKYGIVIYLDGEARVCYDDPASPRIGNIFEASLTELVQRKQLLHPPTISNSDCPLKHCLRQRLYQRISAEIPEAEKISYFGNTFIEGEIA